MKRCKYSSRTMTVAAIAAVVALAGSVFAQSVSVDQVLQADQQRINLAQASQERINEVVEGTRSLADQYRAINKEIDGLRVYNRLMTAQTNGQTATLDDIGLSMEQVDFVVKVDDPGLNSGIGSGTLNIEHARSNPQHPADQLRPRRQLIQRA